MGQHFGKAFGYLSIFLPLGLLVLGQAIGAPYLAFVVIFGVAPLLRVVLGNMPNDLPEWDERTATFLDHLPTYYAAAFPVPIAWLLWNIHTNPPLNGMDWLWLGLSLWSCLFLAVVVGHELIHQTGHRRRLGWLLAGAAGYPLLAHEHLMHHGTSGNVDLAEWPGLNESVWSFVARRSARIVKSAIEFNAVLASRNNKSLLGGGLAEALMMSAVTGAAFAIAGGVAGFLLYVLVAAGVHFGVQAITYLQHWGLGVDSIEGADEGRYGWEDRCQVQGWLMLHLALHHAHHDHATTPYYRLAPNARSPRLPAGYVLLLLISFIPALWRWLMMPALERWKRDPSAQIEPMRWRLICLPEDYSPAKA